MSEEMDQKPFDEQLGMDATEFCFSQFASHPELRTMCVIFGYADNLNEVAKYGVWLNRDKENGVGPVYSTPNITLSVQQTMRMLSEQLKRLDYARQSLEQKLLEVSKELLEAQSNAKQSGNPPVAEGPADRPSDV